MGNFWHIAFGMAFFIPFSTASAAIFDERLPLKESMAITVFTFFSIF
jgi:hypothetical protein